jgi:hypothetical protein
VTDTDSADESARLRKALEAIQYLCELESIGTGIRSDGSVGPLSVAGAAEKAVLKIAAVANAAIAESES